MSIDFEIIHEQQGKYEITVIGTLDISTIDVFNDKVSNIDNIELLVLNFSKLEFIDSTGIGAIMDLIYLSQERCFGVEFIGINENIREIFETIGLFKIFNEIKGGETR